MNIDPDNYWRNAQNGTPSGVSELKAMLGDSDASYAAALLRLLEAAPWPSSDPTWAAIEFWAKDLLRRMNVSPNDGIQPSERSGDRLE